MGGGCTTPGECQDMFAMLRRENALSQSPCMKWTRNKWINIKINQSSAAHSPGGVVTQTAHPAFGNEPGQWWPMLVSHVSTNWPSPGMDRSPITQPHAQNDWWECTPPPPPPPPPPKMTSFLEWAHILDSLESFLSWLHGLFCYVFSAATARFAKCYQ